jgi:uncharacterized Zn-finger protein
VVEDMPVEGYDDHGQVEFVSSYKRNLRLDMRRTSKAVQGWDEEIPADIRQKWIKNFDDGSLIKPFECESCKKQFTKREILERHIKTHMKGKEFKCSYCTKTFDRRDVLNDHVGNHTGEKPFQCTTCNKKFTKGFVLLRHMRTHAEGVYKCDFCFKSFDRKDTYRDHIGEKPFECRFCGKAFSRSFVLAKHERSHVIREELGSESSLDIVDSDNVLVEEIDY